MKNIIKIFSALTIIFFLSFNNANAHCDGLDGPVVKAAKKSLETGNVNYVLIWVQKKDEPEVIKAFEKTLEVGKQSPQAKELADMYFFETVVRLHRSGEGEPYTGLKPAGRDFGPAIPAADLAIEDNSLVKLKELLDNSILEKLHSLFERVVHSKNYELNNVDAGRQFVQSYVAFIHFTEELYEMTKHPDEHLHGELH